MSGGNAFFSSIYNIYTNNKFMVFETQARDDWGIADCLHCLIASDQRESGTLGSELGSP